MVNHPFLISSRNNHGLTTNLSPLTRRRINTKPNWSRSSVRKLNNGKTSVSASKRPYAVRSSRGKTSSCASMPNTRASCTSNCRQRHLHMYAPSYHPHRPPRPPILNFPPLSQTDDDKTQATLVAHTPKHVPFPAADSSATSSATKRGASASSSSKDNRVPAPPPSSPTKAPAFPRIVRRVQAVIEVPVKEEEEEEEEGRYIEEGDEEGRSFVPEDVVSRSRPDPSILYASSTTPTWTGTGTGPDGAGADGGVEGSGGGGGRGGGARGRRKSSASSHHQHQRRSLVVPVPPSDDGNYGYVDDGEEPQSDGSDGGEYVDEEEVENAIANGGGGDGGGGSGTPATVGVRTVPWGRKHIRHEPDEEDDELMMYAKVR